MVEIYRIFCKETGKSYVGQTRNGLDQRFYEHKIKSRNPDKKSKLCRAIRKHGEENFEIFLLEDVDEEVSNEMEKKYVDLYDSFRGGYNSTRGGEWKPNPDYSLESREKMSRNNRWRGIQRFGEDNPNFGKKWTEEQKRSLSEKKRGIQTRLGAVLSDETKKKIGDANRGKQPRLGHKNSEETRKRISESKKGKKLPHTEKTYKIIDPDGNETIITGLLKFCKENGLNAGNIIAYTSKGYKAIKLF